MYAGNSNSYLVSQYIYDRLLTNLASSARFNYLSSTLFIQQYSTWSKLVEDYSDLDSYSDDNETTVAVSTYNMSRFF